MERTNEQKANSASILKQWILGRIISHIIFNNTLLKFLFTVFQLVKTMISRQGMSRSFSHWAVAPMPCIATGKGAGKKIDKVGFTPCGSILSSLGFVTASLCNILLEQ